jgi:superfamily II DNA or RNA helicase
MRDINLETCNIISNQSRAQFFKKWYLDRGLRMVDYQQDILSNKIDFKGDPIVLAVAPGGGKTLMSIATIEKYCIDNPTHKVLVLTHGQTVLRSQYAHNIAKVKPIFTWAMVLSTINSSSDIPQLKSKDIMKSDKQVIICLPQSIKTNDLPHFDLIVVDEAHQFYFANMVQSIIKRVGPIHQLLLTGTPSPFVARKYKNIIAVSLEMLYESGMVSDPIVEIASSSYDFKQSDYNSDFELMDKVVIKEEDTTSTLSMVLKEICKKLQVESNWNTALMAMSKTMLVCRNQKQARDVQNYFMSAKINSAISTSESDSGAEEINRFKNEQDCIVLVVVRRGILGFDYPSLANVIDISCSQNVDRILQLLCRIVRISPTKEQKLFYKVCPIELVDHFKMIMNAVMCLTLQRYYIKFNGKDFLDLPIIAIRTTKENVLRTKRVKLDKRKTTNRQPAFIPVEFSGLPAINFFKNCSSDINNSLLSSYVYTTLREVSQSSNSWRYLTKKEIFNRCKKSFHDNNCKHIADFGGKDSSGYGILLRRHWIDEFCQYMRINRRQNLFIGMTKNEILGCCKQSYVKNDCKRMSDYMERDPSGYSFLSGKKWIRDFHQVCGIDKRKRNWSNMTKEEIFSFIYSNYVLNGCENMTDYRKVDNAGYLFLNKVHLLAEFKNAYGIERKYRNWVNLPKEEIFELLYSKFVENGCTSINDLSKVDCSGTTFLYDHNWMNEFRERYKIINPNVGNNG